MSLKSLVERLTRSSSEDDQGAANKKSAHGTLIEDRLRGIAEREGPLQAAVEVERKQTEGAERFDDASGTGGPEVGVRPGTRLQEGWQAIRHRRTKDPGTAGAAGREESRDSEQVLTWLDRLSKREVSAKKKAEPRVVKATWRSWLVCVPFALVAYYCGNTLGSFQSFYGAVLEGSGHATWVLYKFMIAMALLSLSGGVVAALMRPLARGAVAMAVAAVGLVAGWGINLWSLLGATVLFVAGLSCSMSIEKLIATQVQFPSWSIGRMSTQILTGLSIAACIGLYVGAEEQIAQDGVVVPQRVWSVLGIGSDLYLDLVVPPEYRGPELEQQSEVFQHHVLETIMGLAEPHAGFVPVVYSVLLFSFLAALGRLVTLITGPAIVVSFRLLEAIGLARFEIQTQEVRRLVPG